MRGVPSRGTMCKGPEEEEVGGQLGKQASRDADRESAGHQGAPCTSRSKLGQLSGEGAGCAAPPVPTGGSGRVCTTVSRPRPPPHGHSSEAQSAPSSAPPLSQPHGPAVPRTSGRLNLRWLHMMLKRSCRPGFEPSQPST